MAPEPIVMEDDTGESSAPLVRQDLARMRELAGYSFSRHEAEQWAENDVKFLIYDDTSMQADGFDSDDEEGMLKHAMQLSLGDDVDSDPEISVPDVTHTRENNKCHCMALSAFPETFDPKKLRLYRPQKPLRSCDHYVAVSYCWPQRANTERLLEGHGYHVRDLNGVVRPARAPANVLRRAIDVAISCGFHMIWIDQECLPQPTETSPQEDKEEQQRGIQAMDIIYSRASVTAGLLSDAEVTSQEQLDAMAAIRRQQRPAEDDGFVDLRHPTDVDERTMHLFMEIMSSIITDRWYTRAWVAQEALSAGKSLLLVLSQRQGLPRQSNFTLERPVTAKLKLRISWKTSSSQIFVLPVEVLHETIDMAQSLLPASLIPRADRPSGNIRTVHRLIALKRQMEELNIYLHVYKAASENMRWLVGAAEAPGARYVLDCASAVRMLRSRGCRDVQDRIAIIANMCNYHVRLNTAKMGQRCQSLRLAILTLALANRDYSLLVPDLYAIENEIGLLQQPDGWVWPFDQGLHQIDHKLPRFAGEAVPSLYHHLDNFSHDATGICVSANLWEVTDKIDMTPVQRMWSGEWDKITRIQMHTLPQDVKKGPGPIGGYVKIRDKTPEDADFLTTLRYGSNVVEYDGDWPYGTSISQAFLQVYPETRRIVADMIFAVIRHLYTLSKEPGTAHALGLANSIWHSVRSCPEQISRVPDRVGDWINNSRDVQRHPYKMLKIECGRGGHADALWFLARIMRDGSLWYGRYVTAPARDDIKTHIARVQSALPFSLATKLDTTNPIAHRQIVRNKIARRRDILHVVSSVMKSQTTPQELEKDWHQALSINEIGGYGDWSDENEAYRSSHHASFFDVDGPCLVAVPYSGGWEALPRHPVRTKRICWVVKKTPQEGDGLGAGGEAERPYRVVNKVKGLFEWMSIPRGRYVFAY